MKKSAIRGRQIANTHVSKLHWRIPLPFALNCACVSSFLTTVTKHLAGRMEGEKELFGLTLSIIGGKIQCWERPYLCHGEQVVLGNREQRWEAKADLIIRAPQLGTNRLQLVPMSQRSHISQSTNTSWDQVLNYRSLWMFYIWT